MIAPYRSDFRVRAFREVDRPAVNRLNHDVIDWWRSAANLHLVALPGAGGDAVGQLQVVDRGTTPARREGRCEMRLFVAREHRRRIYDLDTELHADIPVVETEPLEPEPLESWEANFAKKDFSALFLAEADSDWVGMVTGLNWPFTGVRRAFRGRGIATALKV